jgi:hypothetical protein
LYLQTVHGRPILLGYITRFPQSLWNRKDKVKEMVEQGQYAALLRTYRLRYLVVPNDRAGLEQQCAAVFRGAEATIWVAKDDDLARDQPTWRVEPQDDRTLSLHLNSPRHANRRFACVFSRARADRGASAPIAIDDLVQISLDPNNKVFPGSVGVFDAEGRAIVRVDKELVRQLGLGEVWFNWCVWDLQQPLFEQVGPLGSLRID